MKKKISILAAAALCVICAAGCANGATQSQTGTLALATTTTAATEAPATSGTTEAPAVTTEDPTDTTTADTTEAPASEETPAAAVGDSVREKGAFVYRGVTFNIADSADEVIPKLGDQKAPSYKAQPCIPGAGELEHFTYDGLSITVTQFGLISDIGFNATENPDTDAVTAAGIGLGATPEQIKEIYGEPDTDYGFMYIYNDGSYSISFSFDDDTGNVFSVSSSDLDLPL